MPSQNERHELTPLPEPGALRAFSLALLVHLLLGAALTWGVSWKSHDPDVSFSAELWSALPQESAPALVEPPSAPPPPEPVPAPPPLPAPPAPPVTPPAPPPAQVAAEAEIALARDKERKRQKAEELKKAKLQEEKTEQAKLAELAEKKAKAEKIKADKLKAEKAELAEKALKEQKIKEEAQAKAKAEAQAKLEATKQAATQAKQRKEAMDRMMGLAGATGGADAKGSALQSSGPSTSYGGKVRAKIRPNVVFTDDIVGNPVAEVEVRTTLDGTITSQRLVKSSGNKDWDDAVIKAIIRTESLPRDVDGRVPTPLIISFRPKD